MDGMLSDAPAGLFAAAPCLGSLAPRHCPYYNVIRKELTMSSDATLTSKGQTTIPKSIRDSLQMKAGDRMTFTLMPDGVVLMRVKNKHVSDLAGLLYKKGRKPLSVEMLSR
jgi:AbrB family looped-hinge helix DNA binding protein